MLSSRAALRPQLTHFVFLEDVTSAVEPTIPISKPRRSIRTRRAKFVGLALVAFASLAFGSPHFASGRHPALSAPFMSIIADAQSTGQLTGKVTYEGAPKKFKPIDMSAEPNCKKFYDTPPLPEASVTGPGNALQNVIVYISEGAPDEKPSTAPNVQMTQRGCRYAPHIVTLQTSQDVSVKNEDSVTHSIHPMPQANRESNRPQPPGSPPIVIHYERPEIIKVKCDLHPWMRGILAVFKNSHHAVTDSRGAFTLPDLPPGKYTVTAWHETYGTQSKQIVVTAGESQSVNFVFKVTPY